MSRFKLFVAFSVLTLAWLEAGCTTVECGDGTIETDGTCQPADVNPDPASCAPGTHLEDGECVADLDPTVCGDNTIAETDPDTGITTCIGTGGGDCNSSFACPDADSNKVTVCGQLYDAEDNMPIQAPGAGGAACPTDGSGEGPCALQIEFYDAVQFANMPQTAPTLPPETLLIDDCGRFRAVNIPKPGTDFLGIGVDDHDDSGNTDYVTSGVALAVSSGYREADYPAYVIRTTTDELWTADAGDPFTGSTFSEVGVYMPIFLLPNGDGAPGVVITGNGGNTQPLDDYYFEDTADTRSMLSTTQNETGANGTGLFVNTLLVEHSGTGGEPSDCVWESNLAAAIPSVVFAQERQAIGGSCD